MTPVTSRLIVNATPRVQLDTLSRNIQMMKQAFEIYDSWTVRTYIRANGSTGHGLPYLNIH